ncbi:MAG: DNA-binding protein [Eubacteriales bacterium]|nr:DNA-binding protein [Eubacteriales bacterium]
MAETFMVRADEIARELEISKALAYRMIHDWNEDLKSKGYTTVQGRVTRKYYEEQIYGLADRKRKES